MYELVQLRLVQTSIAHPSHSPVSDLVSRRSRRCCPFNDVVTVLLMCLVVVAMHVNAATAGDACPVADSYRCSNGNCVERHLVNNSVNDCGDNSDEAVHPCRAPLFSCRNDRCVYMIWVLDGQNDCIDGTDEAKRIGTNCTMAVNCCHCSDYVPNSECDRQHGVCRCVVGYYSNSLGTACIRRQMNDSCTSNRDCSSVIDGSHCHDNECRCLPRYYATSSSSCAPRTLGSSCETDDQCTEVVLGSVHCNVNSSESNNSSDRGRCECIVGHRARHDLRACLPRQLYESCAVDADCQVSVATAVCRSKMTSTGLESSNGPRTCVCPRSHLLTTGGPKPTCRPRWPGERCTDDGDCLSAVNNTVCDVSGRQCACAYDHSWLPTSAECRYDGADSRVAAVGVGLAVGVVVLGLFDALLLGCVTCKCVVTVRARLDLAVARRDL